MNALDSLKMDIDNYNEVLASRRLELKNHINYLHDNYDNMTVNLIKGVINGLNKEISNITKADHALRIMEKYYTLFKQEQDNATDDFDFMEAFEKWETEHPPNKKYDDDGGVHRMKHKVTCNEDKPLTLCIVKNGEVHKEVKVNTDEFIQIMHEQAEGENK